MRKYSYLIYSYQLNMCRKAAGGLADNSWTVGSTSASMASRGGEPAHRQAATSLAANVHQSVQQAILIANA
jgi:hypothetical protein